MGKILIALAVAIGASAFAQAQPISKVTSTIKKTELESCLHNEKQVQICIQTKIKNLSIDTCFNEAMKLKSDFLKEESLQYCFFNISEFPTLNSCVVKASLFTTAENHDEALFECARQYQLTMSKKVCSNLAKSMRYPEKSKYLARQCETL